MRVQSPFAEERTVPWIDGGRIVEPGEVITIENDQLPHWLEGGWHPADARTLAAARQLIADGATTYRLPEPEAPPAKPAKAAKGTDTSGKVE